MLSLLIFLWSKQNVAGISGHLDSLEFGLSILKEASNRSLQHSQSFRSKCCNIDLQIIWCNDTGSRIALQAYPYILITLTRPCRLTMLIIFDVSLVEASIATFCSIHHLIRRCALRNCRRYAAAVFFCLERLSPDTRIRTH